MALVRKLIIKSSSTYSETLYVGAIYYDSDTNKLMLCTNASGSGTWTELN